MNKIKLLRDVIVTMKNKESLEGTLQVEGKRDNVRIFGLDNEFKKNVAGGRMLAKVSLEIDSEGKKVKHESSTEVKLDDFSGTGVHGFLHRMHSHHACHHGYDHFNDPGGTRHAGIWEKLSHLASMLDILNNLQVEEKEDKSLLLSLDTATISGEMKRHIQNKLHHHKFCHEHEYHDLSGELLNMEISSGTLKLFINKSNEVEKIELIIDGKQENKPGIVHDMNVRAELLFAR